MGILKDKNIVLVVTGGIAAYKSVELSRMLIREGARVWVTMTEAATRFVTPLTFQTLTQRPVASDLWVEDRPEEITHIKLADWAGAVVVAPATANIIGKMAMGLADDLVSTFLLAVRAPILVCPAMNVNMYHHPAVQANLDILRQRNFVVEPASGELACGWEGTGRLPDPQAIVEETKTALTPKNMAGLTVMVTAGPTREAWDEIRYISNRSSGQMGLELARTARRRGAKVILIRGPIAADPPYDVETIDVESTRDMQKAVMENLDRVQVLVKAAAPGDFRPAERATGKIKKNGPLPTITLAQNPDILAGIGKLNSDKILVGFAAESDDLLERAGQKLAAKNLDLIVANQIGRPDEAFGAPTNRVWIIDRDRNTEELPLLSKEEVAHRIWDRVVALTKP